MEYNKNIVIPDDYEPEESDEPKIYHPPVMLIHLPKFWKAIKLLNQALISQ